MSNQLPPQFWRVHLLTLVLVTLTLAWLLKKNLTTHVDMLRVCGRFGWPYCWGMDYNQQFENGYHTVLRVDWSALVVDLAFALSTTLSVALISESLIRRRYFSKAK